jgi:hypothetical protein
MRPIETMALALALVATPIAAQVPASSDEVRAASLAAWVGCWRAVGGDVGAGEMVCVLPTQEPLEVRVLTLEGGAVTGENVLRVDGIERPAEEGGCTGSEVAAWSADGRRIFVRTDLTCRAMGRVSTGVLAFSAPEEWVDVQALTVAGQHASRVIRYRAVSATEIPQSVVAELPRSTIAVETARLNASAPMGIDDVIEAGRMIAPPALEGLLAFRGHGFPLDARALVRLEREGLPASAIDVMVALSFPERFAIRSPAAPGVISDARVPMASAALMGWGMECADYRFRSAREQRDCLLAYGYSPYGNYSPFGYDPYGWNRGPSIIVVVPVGDIEDTAAATAVRGQGYTRGGAEATGAARPRDTANVPSTSAAPAQGSGTTTGNGSADPPPPARTAVPRDP